MAKVAVTKKQFCENKLKQILYSVWNEMELSRTSSEGKTKMKQAEKELLEWACNFEG
jgi:hypothetical protein